MSGPFGLMVARAELYRRAGPSRLFLDYVRRHRVDLTLVSGFCGCLAVLPVLSFERSMFDFADAGHEDAIDAAIIEAFDTDGETVLDLVAWPLDEPERVLSLYRRVPLVGMWEAASPYTYTFETPLILHRTPLDWLKAGCRGAAIVVPDLAARFLIDLPGRFAPQDRQHAAEVHHLLQRLTRNRMVVPREGRRAA
jgi:hypothetical protein